ncbi:toxic anion resistance protein [Gulosibacter molinativorax]|uniref:Toxic anion resistance protein n=1 Tax=Gulosibacter molinativorax TaxID=256821 RepID=A0ABT7C5X8_9MICO|nr:toxic anion resistance protein [Gulosibacter molinativorax]MDJ1370612.1 toxic anion resistance protein [Gulosibacter molinativorax]QUY61974.1 Toxic anion resistance protein [Gulosibacter molinativorax]
MNQKLQPPSPEDLEPIEAAPPVQEVEPAKAHSMLPDVDPNTALDLQHRADTWVGHLATLKPKTPEYTEQVRAISQVARQEIQQTTNATGRFFERSLNQAKTEGDGGQAVEVSKSLVDLRNVVEELQPEQQNAVGRFFGKLPGSRGVKRYFRQYESNQDQLNAVLHALERGQDNLRKDNAALSLERRTLWDAMGELNKLSALLTELDQSVLRKMDQLSAQGQVEEVKALEQDVLFAIRQRHMDVQTQLAVSVQSYLSMDLIQDNNLKLVDGVERAKTTTMTALRTAVVVAQALENQRLVLDQIDAVNATTNSMIEKTSGMLRDNSARIQEQAVTSGVTMETLQKAYDNVFAAIDQVEQFRSTANKNFATSIESLSQQLERATPYIERSRENELSREAENSGQVGAGKLPPELTL